MDCKKCLFVCFLNTKQAKICFKVHTADIPTRTFILQSQSQHQSLITNEDSLLLDKTYFYTCCSSGNTY